MADEIVKEAPKNSEFGKLNRFDLVKGLLMAVLSAVGGGLLAAAQAGTLFSSAVLVGAGKTAAVAAAAYLFKNWFSDGDGKFIRLVE